LGAAAAFRLCRKRLVTLRINNRRHTTVLVEPFNFGFHHASQSASGHSPVNDAIGFLEPGDETFAVKCDFDIEWFVYIHHGVGDSLRC
jgi:hypothetical protein